MEPTLTEHAYILTDKAVFKKSDLVVYDYFPIIFHFISSIKFIFPEYKLVKEKVY